MSYHKSNDVDPTGTGPDDKAVWDAMRNHVKRAACPQNGVVPSADHPALVAALCGIDQAQHRLGRDAKLQHKFSNANNNCNKTVHSHNNNRSYNIAAAATTATPMNADEESLVKIEKPQVEKKRSGLNMNNSSSIKTSSNSMIDEDDWHEIHNYDEAATSAGTQAVTQAVISQAVPCRTSLGAMAMALHVAMLRAGYACTGVLKNATSAGDSSSGCTGTGFAAPVRPIDSFLPVGWEDHVSSNNKIQLRYRKEEAVVLTVERIINGVASDGIVRVGLSSSSAILEFALSEHLNNNSWLQALQKNTHVSPTLHYKALGALLLKFAETFDLELHQGAENARGTLYYKDRTMQDSPPATTTDSGSRNLPQYPPLRVAGGSLPTGAPVFDPIHDFRPTLVRPQGDFHSDLTPAGLWPGVTLPNGMTIPGNGMMPDGVPNNGNLMGPGHPGFGGVSSGDGRIRPRWDPTGPSPPVNPSGNPNNDLARPPHPDGNNMFL